MKLYNFHLKFSDNSVCEYLCGAESLIKAQAKFPEWEQSNLHNVEFICEGDAKNFIWTLDEEVEVLFQQILELTNFAERLRDTELVIEDSKKQEVKYLEPDTQVLGNLIQMAEVIEEKVHKAKRYIEMMNNLAQRGDEIFKSDQPSPSATQ